MPHRRWNRIRYVRRLMIPGQKPYRPHRPKPQERPLISPAAVAALCHDVWIGLLSDNVLAKRYNLDISVIERMRLEMRLEKQPPCLSPTS